MTNPAAPSEHVRFNAPEPRAQSTWWTRYRDAITGLSPDALRALEADCHYIVDCGIFGEPTEEHRQLSSRARTGLVMGSVQSGKTASMLGVTAMSVDKGVDIVVILAGTRLSLWRQTYGRLRRQLDSGPDTAAKHSSRVLVPANGAVESADSINLPDLYAIQPATVRNKLRRRRPIIVVAMKQTNHLHALADSLRTNVFPNIAALDRPGRMLILDDEADDGSILDAVAELGQDPVFGNLKQVPRAIANLWDSPQGTPRNLLATYVAYTATPQANFLQEDHNPLAPRDFLVSLRTPLDTGQAVNEADSCAPRSSTYPDPAGLPAFYTGGEVFYRRGRAAHLCRELTSDNVADLSEAVRAFLVAGAIRLHRSGRLGPVSAASATFGTSEAASEAVMEPHSMLYHPSASIQDHFQSAEDLLVWAGVPNRVAARALIDTGCATLPQTLVSTMFADPLPWKAWLERYEQSARAIETEFNLINPRAFPDWPTVQTLLADEIIPGTRVSVVNSDPDADDSPAYSPEVGQDDGKWHAARDMCTIFVSGNVMARGITLEGLTTAFFQRSSTSPLADTQMQMQRWFGYRGSHVELCRLFASKDQLALFSAYHDTDEAIRATILEGMAGGRAPEPVVLQGINFTATGKIANVRTSPLSPGARPFITVLNDGREPDPNAELVAELFASGSSSPLIVGGRQRGRILDEPCHLLDVANWLDRLAYSRYVPGDSSLLADHWANVEARLSVREPLAEHLYRPPAKGVPGDLTRRACPYSTAAYLRLWDAALTRHVPGLFVTGEPGQPWSMSDLQLRQQRQPRFWVGIRFGDGCPVGTGTLSQLPFAINATMKNVDSTGELTTTWGASDPTAGPGQYRSDLYFDYYRSGGPPLPQELVESTWRPPGSDGQLLIYVNQLHAQPYPAVAVALCIPAGGPEQFAATRASAIMS